MFSRFVYLGKLKYCFLHIINCVDLLNTNVLHLPLFGSTLGIVVVATVGFLVVVVFLQFGTRQVFGQCFLVQTEYLCPSLQ